MNSMFSGAENFNQPLYSWFVWNVKDMGFMFYEAKNFNQNLNNWNVWNVRDMKYMFNGASNFNRNNISDWRNVDEKSMF